MKDGDGEVSIRHYQLVIVKEASSSCRDKWKKAKKFVRSKARQVSRVSNSRTRVSIEGISIE
jgi:hypothetical protein